MIFKTAAALFRITRPLNGLIAILSIITAAFIAGADGGDIERILLTALAGAAIGSFGNVLNDFFDVAIDAINVPQRMLPSGRISKATALAWALTLLAIGIVLAAMVSIPVVAIAAAAAVVIWLYDWKLKRVPLVGNALVAIVTGVAFIFGAAAVDNAAAGIVPCAFAAMFNFLREIVKDIADQEGDRALGIRTVPIAAGEHVAARIVAVCCILVIAASPLPFIAGLYTLGYLIAMVVGVDLVLAFVISRVLRDRSPASMRQTSTLLKYDMLVGILAIVLGTI